MLRAMSGFAPQPTRAGLHRSLCHVSGQSPTTTRTRTVCQALRLSVAAEPADFCRQGPAVLWFRVHFNNCFPHFELTNNVFGCLSVMIVLPSSSCFRPFCRFILFSGALDRTALRLWLQIFQTSLAPGLQPEK